MGDTREPGRLAQARTVLPRDQRNRGHYPLTMDGLQRAREPTKSLERLPGVLGVALTGSQARSGTTSQYSDVDLIAFVLDDFATQLPAIDGVDIAVYRESSAGAPKLPAEDFELWYNRAALLHARPLFERAHGQVAAWLLGQSTLTPDEADTVVRDHLDGYLNLAIRALKSERDGRQFGSALDSVEAVGWGLTTIFALEQRVRPFNKYLEWELTNYPLVSAEFGGGRFLAVVAAILSGKASQHRALYALVTPVARRAGFGALVDDWGQDLALFAAPARDHADN